MSERFEMRLETEMLERIDAWRGSEDDLPSRAEAVRRLVNVGLVIAQRDEFTITDGERLIISMLGDLLRHSHVDTDLDLPFIEEMISSGQVWALSERYPSVFGKSRHEEPSMVAEAREILMMWSFIERGFSLLSPTEQSRVRDTVSHSPTFPGFDGTIEAEILQTTHALIRIHAHQRQPFGDFAGRDLDAHVPMIETYRRMVPIFRPLVAPLVYLTADQIIELLRAMVR